MRPSMGTDLMPCVIRILHPAHNGVIVDAIVYYQQSSSQKRRQRAISAGGGFDQICKLTVIAICNDERVFD